jgi:glycosyltransferase involved in cell wall biosynthesis
MRYKFITEPSKPKTVTVITPTTVSPKLEDALVGVQNQTYKHIQHLLVVDGPEYMTALTNHIDIVRNIEHNNVILTSTPENTGANGYNGQRIYASYPHLVNSDYVFFLDQDNWYEPDHVESLVNLMRSENLDWAYSLRKIYTINKEFVADDNCESLGKWPIFFSHGNPQYLIDTSCFAFTRSFIQQTCHLWHSGPWGEDRRYLDAIREKSKWNTTGRHTLCYRLEGNEKSVTKDFFVEGNEKQLNHYKGKFPWQRT